MTLFGGEKKNQINKYRNAYNFLDSKKEINSNAFMLDEIANRLERFLIRADRFGMMESIELRVPYLTKSMVKLALNTPYSKKTSFRPSLINRTMFSNKVILKRVAKSMGIPKSIVKRAKVGTAISEINFKNDLSNFEQLMSSTPQDEDQKIKDIKAIYESTDVRRRTTELAMKYTKNAMDALTRSSLNNNTINYFTVFVEELMMRTK